MMLLPLLTAGILLLAGSAALADEIAPTPPAVRARQSAVVVVGDVIGVGSRWAADGSVIVTDAEVRVLETWKGGPLGETIVVTALGGTVEETTLVVTGSPSLVPGSRSLFFLRRSPRGLEPWGMRYGVLRIEGERGAEYVVAERPEGAEGGEVSIDLDALRRELRTVTEESR
jgi:hypothetical protein